MPISVFDPSFFWPHIFFRRLDMFCNTATF